MILNRLHQYMLEQNLSFNKLEIAINVSHGSVSNAWKHGKNVGSKVIEKVLNTYPDISAEWLLRGKGKMIVASKIQNSEQLSVSDIKVNEELIEKCLIFFNCKDKNQLNEILIHPNRTLEDTILTTWENKYGQELKSINRRLMTLFTAKLTSELDAKNRDQDAKVS